MNVFINIGNGGLVCKGFRGKSGSYIGGVVGFDV